MARSGASCGPARRRAVGRICARGARPARLSLRVAQRARGSTGRVSVEGLERELASLGIRGTIDGLGSLAVLTLLDEQVVDDRTRAAVVQLATQHGFTHIA